MEKSYIADIIGEEYKEWDSSKSVVIHAPMGSGKTYFVLNVLLPYVHSKGGKIVYFVNRSALEEQVNKDIPDEYKKSITTCSYQRLPNFYPLEIKENMIFNYGTKKEIQRMEALISADYYILDEAHYFLTDTDFNTKIETCFEALADFNREKGDRILIFMTGTIDYLLLQLQWRNSLTRFKSFDRSSKEVEINPPLEDYWFYSSAHIHSVKALLTYKETPKRLIKYLEAYQFPMHPYEISTHLDDLLFDVNDRLMNFLPYYSFRCRLHQDWRMLPEQINCFRDEYFQKTFKQITDHLHQDIESNYYLYTLPQDFSYITPVYFNDWEEIATGIARTPQEEKWIIFVSSKIEGEILSQKIKEKVCTSVPLMTSKRRKNKELLESETFREIVENASFSQRVLITTKVLDNGINLKDESLKHMVIGTFDKTTFLQIVGRKRRIQQSERLKLYLKDEPEGIIQRQFGNHILQIFLFWRDLSSMKYSDYGLNFSSKLNWFTSKYIEDGKLKYPFSKYAVKEDIGFRKEFHSLADIYQPAKYPKRKLSYDYYQMMAIFEQAQNERFLMAKEQGIQTEKDYQAIEKDLRSQQFMWLRTQLSWLGLDVNQFDPHNPENWITSHSGQAQQDKQNLLTFLSTHSSGAALSEEEEQALKGCFQNWIQSIRPKHKDRNSKGSISIINRCFQEFSIPYQIENRRITIHKKQRNWWFVRPILKDQNLSNGIS